MKHLFIVDKVPGSGTAFLAVHSEYYTGFNEALPRSRPASTWHGAVTGCLYVWGKKKQTGPIVSIDLRQQSGIPGGRRGPDRRQHVQAGGVNWQLGSLKAPSGSRRPEVEVAHPELGQ